MADAASPGSAAQTVVLGALPPRHPLFVRVTHWLTFLSFLALLVTGAEIVISHPRFYWGEVGNPNTPALFQLPIPASRPWVNTGYPYVLPDQNGWSRSLHFQAAWLCVLTGLFYITGGLATRHFQRNLLPPNPNYNPLQRSTYLAVIFGLFPLLIWTGLAMSPALAAAYPWLAAVTGGHQSARTLHFFATVLLVLFVAGHVMMVWRAGFRPRVTAMITGGQSQ
jgi:thiosulfate reductase cytochrome b subunit